MKKVIIPFDGTNFSEGAFDFASKMNVFEPILLVGLFLPRVDYSSIWSYSGGGMAGPVFIPMVEDEDVAVINENIVRFKYLCASNHIEYRVHEDYVEFALPELKRETRFADLLILGSQEFFKYMGTIEPNSFLKDSLEHAECPVLVVPEHFTFPESIVLAYDGSEDSVFAIKQFAYLFPQLTGLPTLLITVDSKHSASDLPEQSNIEELVARHFSQLTLSKLEFDSRKHFATWMATRKTAILVSGAFGRSAFSESIKKSFASEVITTHQLPIFVAHR